MWQPSAAPEKLHLLDGAKDIEKLVADLANAAETAAHATFGPFADEPDSLFAEARSLGLTPQETWQAIASQMPRAIAQAVSAAVYRTPIAVELIRSWHRVLFGAVFADYAGVFHEDRERGQYAATVGGIPDDPVVKTYAGTMGRHIYGELRDLCETFDRAARAEDLIDEGDVASAVAWATSVYAGVLRIHPFLDGNGRTAYVVLLYALGRLNLPSVRLDDFREYQFALGQAIRRDEKRSEVQLTRLLADKILHAGSQETAGNG